MLPLGGFFPARTHLLIYIVNICRPAVFRLTTNKILFALGEFNLGEIKIHINKYNIR